MGHRFNGMHRIVYNSVNPDLYKPRRKKLPNATLIILLCGSHQQFYRVKLAVDTLNEILKKNISAKLIISGRLDWKNAENVTRKYIDKLGLIYYD